MIGRGVIEGDPLLTLSNGTIVYEGLLDSIVGLLERGHSVTVDEEGDVEVKPPCEEGLEEYLEMHSEAAAAIVRELGRVH